MKFRQNMMVGLANSIWTLLANLAAIPFYIKLLGIESYGLVGFALTVQSALLILDFGLTPTINREVARHTAQNKTSEAGSLLFSLSVIYWITAVAIIVGITLASRTISEHWLKPETLSPDTVQEAITLIGVVIGCRWPTSLYQGALMGAQKMALSSTVSIIQVTLNTIGGIAILAFISPTIQALFLWQALIALLGSLALRNLAWKTVGASRAFFDFKELKRIWKFSAGLLGVSITGLAISQIDKLMLSKLVSLTHFGQYILATTIAGSLYVLITPIFNAVYPRLSLLAVQNEKKRLVSTYHQSCRFMAILVFPISMGLVLFGRPIIEVWTGDSEIAANVAPLVSILGVGIAIHGIMHLPYALQLSNGHTKLPLKINTILLSAFLPVLYISIKQYQTTGAALSVFWVYMLYFLIGIPLTHRLLVPNEGRRWILNTVGKPLALTLIIGFIGHFFAGHYELELPTQLALAFTTTILAILSCFAISPELRKDVGKILLNLFSPVKVLDD